MKAVISGVVVATVLAVLVAGCTGPRLASLPLTEEQMEWTSFVRASYPGWKPPYYSPVVSRDPSAVPAETLPAAPVSPAPRSGPAAGGVEFVPAESLR